MMSISKSPFSIVLGLIAASALCVAHAAEGATLTYPGAAPCNTTLQACIDGAASGDEIEIATNTPIDEALSVSESLTLRAATGFTPTIGGGVTTRVLSLNGIGSVADNEVVLIEGLFFDNARINGFITQATGHTITVRNNILFFEVESNNTPAVGFDYRVPGSLVVASNQITSTGQGIRLFAILESDSVDYLIERNIITTSLPAESNTGISFDLRGTGTYTMSAFSNVVYGVAGCSCGGNGGIVVDIVTGAQVTASLNNNTVDGTETANGFNVLIRDPDAVLTLNLFNNSVSNSDRNGFRINNFGEGTVILNADANNSYLNLSGDDFDGHPAGKVTSYFPAYVDASGGNFRLVNFSHLINAGVDAPTGGNSSLDADGVARIQGPQIDVGAYEQAKRLPDAAIPIPTLGFFALAALGGILLLTALIQLRRRSHGSG